MANNFTWIPIYQEVASRLLDWESRQQELIEFAEQMRSDGLISTSKTKSNIVALLRKNFQSCIGRRAVLDAVDPNILASGRVRIYCNCLDVMIDKENSSKIERS